MSIWQAIRHCIVSKYANGHGRACRGEFFSFLIAYAIFNLTWTGMVWLLVVSGGDVNLIDFVLMYIPFIFLPPLFAVSIRRLHDTNKNGWLVLLMLVPLINIFGFALLAMSGTPGPNRYGPVPESVHW